MTLLQSRMVSFGMTLQRVLSLLICSLLPCYGLQCTNDCSYTSSLSKPFHVPVSCTQMISAGKCAVLIDFWYNREEYVVTFTGEPSTTIFSIDNRRSVLLALPPRSEAFFSYSILQTCKDRDDCTRDLAEKTVTNMLQRNYPYDSIMNELASLASGPPHSVNHSDLSCFVSDQNVRQCAIATKPGSCVISNVLTKKSTSYSCDNERDTGDASVSLYQSENYATFTVQCNRPLCNGHMTMQSAKDILFRYNITKTVDGHLDDGSAIVVSIGLVLLTTLLSLMHQL